MKELYKNKKVFLVGGSGGVGKTTIAASLGVKLALEGYKTIVLTVDPAKRLAQALGLESFSGDLQTVNLPNAKHSVLYTSMLDTRRDFDRLIYKFSKTEEQRDRILNSRIYRVMVDSLGGSHEYAAMERLLEFTKDEKFERIVIDTPPSQNAVDLFAAPERLAEFMDNSVLKWFQGDAPKFLSFFKQGTKIAMKALEKIFGNEFFEELGRVLQDLEGMQAGFRSRNLEVMETLKSTETAFLLVTYPSEMRFSETKEFLKTLNQYSIPVAGLFLNRLEPISPQSSPCDASLAEDVRALIDPVLNYSFELYEEQKRWVEEFTRVFSTTPTFKIYKQLKSLHDVEALAGLEGF